MATSTHFGTTRMSERRTREIRSRVDVRPAVRSDVDWMIRRHYLHKWPGVVVAILALCRDDEPVGCIVFALPPAATYKRYGGLTWELARLWVDDSEPTNTESWFIARAVRWVKANRPDVWALVSYADPSVGHLGTVYRAANWMADGRTDDERKSPRCDYLCDGKIYSRMGHLPEGRPFERVPRVSKYRFVMGLSFGARLSLKQRERERRERTARQTSRERQGQQLRPALVASEGGSA